MCLQKEGPFIFKGLQPSGCSVPCSRSAAGSWVPTWREAVITWALPEVFLLVLPSDGWRVLPADLQVYPPIWRAGGRLANTLYLDVLFSRIKLSFSSTFPGKITICKAKLKIKHFLSTPLKFKHFSRPVRTLKPLPEPMMPMIREWKWVKRYTCVESTRPISSILYFHHFFQN